MDGQISIAHSSTPPRAFALGQDTPALLMLQEKPKLCLGFCVTPEHRQHSKVHILVYVILHRLWIACVGHRE